MIFPKIAVYLLKKMSYADFKEQNQVYSLA